ncbi:MAG: M15 family metallopeptidase [Anaerovoracaceae bacterium]
METEPKKKMNQWKNLVRLTDLDGDFLIDLKYAGKDNFTGCIIYPFTDCYVDIHTAGQLIEVRDRAKALGFRMKIWDAYRPIRAQQKFWDLIQDDTFVAHPPDMSVLKIFRNSHMNGQCVDVTLTDIDGQDIPMPSDFDDFTGRARLDWPHTGKEERRNGELLRRIMTESGFTPYDGEWWHFYDRNANPVPYLDIVTFD